MRRCAIPRPPPIYCRLTTAAIISISIRPAIKRWPTGSTWPCFRTDQLTPNPGDRQQFQTRLRPRSAPLAILSWRGPLLERSANRRAVGRFDTIAKDIVANAPKVAAPSDDARPRQRAPEGAAPQGPAPSRPRDDSSDDSRESSQKPLKSVAPPRADQQVQMRAHVGKL